SLVTGSGAPTAGMVYKLVTVDGRPVAKRSSHKESRGGSKAAVRTSRASGTIVEEIVYPLGSNPRVDDGVVATELSVPLVRGGEQVDGAPSLDDSRTLLAERLVSLPWEGLKLSQGEPAIPTRFL
ncbi:MAG: nicotinate phosphoribosyltransferase, partial [Rhodococcus sp. (in: high G+C Gram-positive bacteria)]